MLRLTYTVRDPLDVASKYNLAARERGQRLLYLRPYPTLNETEDMLTRTHIPEAPWWVVEAVDKKRARLNCISHLLGQIPYGDVPHEHVTLPDRVFNPDYERDVLPRELYVPELY